LTEGPSTNSNVKVCNTGSTAYNTGVQTPSRLALVVHLASCTNNWLSEWSIQDIWWDTGTIIVIIIIRACLDWFIWAYLLQ
jgi:hypothetical protein